MGITAAGVKPPLFNHPPTDGCAALQRLDADVAALNVCRGLWSDNLPTSTKLTFLSPRWRPCDPLQMLTLDDPLKPDTLKHACRCISPSNSGDRLHMHCHGRARSAGRIDRTKWRRNEVYR